MERKLLFLFKFGLILAVALGTAGCSTPTGSGQQVALVTSSGGGSTASGPGSSSTPGSSYSVFLSGVNNPRGLAVDLAGNLYIADPDNNLVRKVSSSGVAAIFAGTGLAGFLGDNGLATSAQLYQPTGVAVDSSGNVFIADSYNYRIRKVSASGIITTVAGNGSWGSAGDGGAATAARLDSPKGVAVDTLGNLYIADTYNNRIRKVSTVGIITTVAGTGTSGFSGDNGPATLGALDEPTGVAVDSSQNIYIADTYNYRIRKVSGSSAVITTIAGNGSLIFAGDGGSATAAALFSPSGVAVDSSRNIYIADTYNDRIRKVNTSGSISTVAGGGSSLTGTGALSLSLSVPFGVVLDTTGNLYLSDSGNNRILKVSGGGGGTGP